MLEMGRVVIERDALEELFLDHESDLSRNLTLAHQWSF
jgi:hypothetical protein